MSTLTPIRCRLAACRESLDDGNAWSFYLINDSVAALDLSVLEQVGYEWGDMGNTEAVDVRVMALAPGASALIWRDDGSGAELRMDFRLRIEAAGGECRLYFEFPKLYRMTNLPIVQGLGKAGYEVAAEGT